MVVLVLVFSVILLLGDLVVLGCQWFGHACVLIGGLRDFGFGVRASAWFGVVFFGLVLLVRLFSVCVVG